MSKKTIIDPEWGWSQPFQYSQAVKVGNLMFISGQVGIDPEGNIVGNGDIKVQAKQAFENLKTVLSTAGATLEDVIEITTFHTDISDIEKVMEVKSQYFKEDFPAWTAIGVSALAMEDLMLEIKAIAVVD